MNDKPRLIDANKIPFKEYMGYDEGMVFEHEIEAMPTITPTPQWIPVTERLPEDLSFVFMASIDEGIVIGQFDREESEWINYLGLNLELNSVVAWMPLPEPYKAKMDGKDGE